MSIVAAIVAGLARDFPSADVSSVAPHMRNNDRAAIGVALDAGQALGSLTQSQLTLSVVNHECDETGFNALREALTAWRPATVSANGETWRIVLWRRMGHAKSTRTVDGYLFGADRFTVAYKKEV